MTEFRRVLFRSSHYVVSVHPSLPDSLKGLIDLARDKPGQLSYASPGVGSLGHLASELLLQTTKLKVLHVPYKGVGNAMPDLLSGRTSIVITPAVALVPHFRAGRLRALAVTGAARMADLPDVPLIGDKIIHLDGKAWHEIQQVNADVNESMRTREDKDHYGRAEVWTIPTDGLGDCEDFALTKQKMLMALGITLRALRLAVVETRQGIGHVVLTVATDRGDYVLDNLSPWVLPWRQKDFTWFERQDPDHPWGWVQLNAKPGPALTSSIGAGCPA